MYDWLICHVCLYLLLARSIFHLLSWRQYRSQISERGTLWHWHRPLLLHSFDYHCHDVPFTPWIITLIRNDTGRYGCKEDKIVLRSRFDDPLQSDCKHNIHTHADRNASDESSNNCRGLWEYLCDDTLADRGTQDRQYHMLIRRAEIWAKVRQYPDAWDCNVHCYMYSLACRTMDHYLA